MFIKQKHNWMGKKRHQQVNYTIRLVKYTQAESTGSRWRKYYILLIGS